MYFVIPKAYGVSALNFQRGETMKASLEIADLFE